MKTLGVGGTIEFLRWCDKTGWRPLFHRHCTHPEHRHKRHFWSRMKGYRLYQRDWHLTGEQLREPVQREQICEIDLLKAWNLDRTGFETSTGGRIGAR